MRYVRHADPEQRLKHDARHPPSLPLPGAVQWREHDHSPRPFHQQRGSSRPVPRVAASSFVVRNSLVITDILRGNLARA
jgi:hypothetical protein